jgi:hypothetical protein
VNACTFLRAADAPRAPFLAIFDADFHPESSFLLKTIPYLNVRELSALHVTKN